MAQDTADDVDVVEVILGTDEETDDEPDNKNPRARSPWPNDIEGRPDHLTVPDEIAFHRDYGCDTPIAFSSDVLPTGRNY